MYINAGYISAHQSQIKDCTSIYQLCANSGIKQFDEQTQQQTEIFKKNTEQHTSYLQYAPNENACSKEINSLLITALLMIYIFVIILSKNYIAMSGNIIFPKKNNNAAYSELPHSFTFASGVLSFFSILVIAALIYLFGNKIYTLQQISFKIFAIIIGITLAYVGFKTLCIKIIGYVSENNDLKSKIYAIETTVLSMYGLFSCFFLMLCFLNNPHNVNTWLIVALITLALLYILKISKIIMIFIDEKISPFFLILYLCALEILPVWFIIDLLL
jgi:hypothetical protein